MAKKPRSPVLDYLVFLIVRLAVCFLQTLPLRIGARLASILAWLAYHVDKRHREVAQRIFDTPFRSVVRIPAPAIGSCEAAISIFV